ncbi:MAG TPA: MFS transporter, partial [Actinomycetota bacterium]|nr:MFS transporter [Actinomycetota bacterium]
LAGGAAGFGAVAVVGPTGAFAIAGVAYFGSAWFAHRLASSLAHPHPKGTRFVEDAIEIARDLSEGLRTLWAEARLRLPLAGIFVLRTVTVFVAIVAILFIKDAFPEAGERAGRLSWSAIVLGVAGAGAFIGALSTPFFHRRLDKQAIIILGFVVSGAGIAALGGVEHIAAILVLTFAAGFGNLLTKVAVDACMQEELSDDFRGRGFAVYDIVYNLASVAAAALMVAVQASSLRTVSVATGVATLACAGFLRVGFAASAR